MAKTLQLIKDFCRYDFGERDGEKALSFLTDDIKWIGTSDHEDVVGIEEAREYVNTEIEEMPMPYKLSLTEGSETSLGNGSGIAFVRVKFENEGVTSYIRITCTSRLDAGEEKICAMHFSVADDKQLEGEFFPVTKGKAEIARERNELVMSTMQGGMVGGYIGPGFPFYYVSERMLKLLGYESEAQYIEDLDGMVMNGIHPDDVDRVDEEVNKQLANDDRYASDYRMKKYDGSYIWVHDIGRRSEDEEGRPVVISVCYDTTKDHEKQAQIDNIVDALPGGVTLVRIENGAPKIIYQSRGVSALSGRTPDEYRDMMENREDHGVYTEDLDRFRDGIRRAAETDETVSLDFRSTHKDGGYVWITGNIRKVGTEDGVPLIQGVFTEMPQMRELFMHIADDAGVAIVVSDKKTHELLYLNKEIFSILGKTDRRFEGKKCYEYLLGESEMCSFCKDRQTGDTQHKAEELYIPQLDRWYMTQGRVINWAGREAHVEYLSDITEGMKAKENLTDILENVECGLVVGLYDPKETDILDEYFSRGFYKLFDVTEEYLSGRKEKDYICNVHPDDLADAERMTDEVKRGVKHAEGTFRYIFDSGQIRSMRVEANTVSHNDGTISIYSTFYDVTDQVQQERQLRDVIHNVPGGVCLYEWDGEKLHPIIISEQFSVLLGEDAWARIDAAEGTNYKNVHPDDLAGLQEEIAKTFKAGGEIRYTYRVWNKKIGDYIWLNLHGKIVEQEDGSQLVYVMYSDMMQERLMEQDLKVRERVLDYATEKAGLWFWKYEPDNDRAYFSGRIRKDFKLPDHIEDFPEAWLKMGFIMPDYIETYRRGVMKIKNGAQQAVFESKVRFLDGSIHWGEFRMTRIPEEEGGSAVAACTGHLIDSEKILLAQYELEKEKPSLGENELLIHASFDLGTGETMDYGFTNGEQHLERIYRTFREVVEHSAEGIVDKKDRETFLRINDENYLKERMENGELSLYMDHRRRMPEGRIIWVRNILHMTNSTDSHGILLIEYCYDINLQKMADEILMSTTVYDYERIASVDFDSGEMIPYGAFRDLEDKGPFVYNDVRNEYASERVVPDDREFFISNTRGDVVTEHVAAEGSFSFLVRIKKEDGSKGIVKTRFVPYDEEHHCYIMTRTDVTDMLREEEEKNDILRDALYLTKQANNAKSDFLASMSHDIRTPMNAIVGMCELARQDENDKDQVHESLETISSSSKLLLSLVNNILDMSRIESGKLIMENRPFRIKEEVDIATRGCIGMAHKKGLEFNIDIDISHDYCIGDIGRIHSAVDNLLSNAVKYTPEGGKIHYSISEKKSGKPGIGLYRFTVTDNGVGISRAEQKSLFEPFYRVESEPNTHIEGTGLGLSISKAIVDLIGGTISVKSAKGRGSTFVIELPLKFAEDEADADITAKEKDTESWRDLTGLRVLICEDHPVNRKVAERILERAGAETDSACDGREGAKIFADSEAGTYDAILMDIRMPVMDGYEATRAIRSSGHPQAETIPVIAMTANAFAEDMKKSKEAGMDAHFAKPIVPDELCHAILECIKEKKKCK